LLGLSLLMLEAKPQVPRRNDRDSGVLAKFQQCAIAGDEDLNLRARGTLENRNVSGVDPRWRSGRRRHGRGAFQFRDEAGHQFDALRGDAQLAQKIAPQLHQDGSADHDVVLGKQGAQQIRAQAARCKRGVENVGVRENPQDTAANTSSSVSKPRASANGSTMRRASSKRATAS